MAKTKPRYVFDTNTLVSATLFAHSTPGRAFHYALKRGVLLISADSLSELFEVLSREKLDRYVTQDERAEFIEALVARAEIVEPVESIQECRDPKDDRFLELAVAGQADAIVSGDADLLVLHPFREVSILTPTDFLKRFRWGGRIREVIRTRLRPRH